LELIVQFQYCHKGALWNFHIAHLTHSFLTRFLLFEQFALTADITAITLRSYIFSNGRYILTRYNLGTNGSLNRNFKLLFGNQVLQFFADFLAQVMRVIAVDDGTECIYLLAV
jgi:hypothetical protein